MRLDQTSLAETLIAKAASPAARAAARAVAATAQAEGPGRVLYVRVASDAEWRALPVSAQEAEYEQWQLGSYLSGVHFGYDSHEKATAPAMAGNIDTEKANIIDVARGGCVAVVTPGGVPLGLRFAAGPDDRGAIVSSFEDAIVSSIEDGWGEERGRAVGENDTCSTTLRKAGGLSR